MQTLVKSFLAFAPIAVFAAACGSSGTTDQASGGAASGGAGGSSGDACVLSADVRNMVEETLTELSLTAIDVAKNSSATQYGFGIQIPGAEHSFVGYTTVISTCPNNSVVTSCDSTKGGSSDPFWMSVHDRCVRFRCEAGGNNIALVDTYLTMQPIKSATDKHEFTYDTTHPTGTATFDPNPFLTWRIDLTDLAAIQVDAKLTNVVRILQTDDTFIDFTHTGTAAVSRTDADVSLATLDLEWPSLLEGGDKLTGSVQVDAAGGVNGEVKAGDTIIAGIKDDYQFAWQGACAGSQ
ncbi:MAG: hypothetical protein HUU21_06825 [Polyangiaceae bacterium]|nr:hypothetical protein [Polyangiaceae bacterium]NUQ73250.1 hypothetical protein [Polyangiaceae bacterium]